MLCHHLGSGDLIASNRLEWTTDESVPLQLGLEELLGHGLPDVEAVGAAPGAGEERPAHVSAGGAHQVPGVTAVQGRPGGSQPAHHTRQERGARRRSRRQSSMNVDLRPPPRTAHVLLPQTQGEGVRVVGGLLGQVCIDVSARVDFVGCSWNGFSWVSIGCSWNGFSWVGG